MGNNIRSNSQDFEGGEVTTIFGGAEIDLRHIAVTEKAHLELTCIFGGWDNKTKGFTYESDTPVLYINYFPIFGEIEIKN